MAAEAKASMFRAFKNRNYALYFSGQSVSLIGTWMQQSAISWMVYTMTHSLFMLGATVAAQRLPSFLFSLYGGILADRYNRFKILLITQSASMAQAIILAVMVFTHTYSVWSIMLICLILGIINSFDVPARQPLVHELVNNKDDLPNALAFNSSMVNFARLVGPALSGIVYEAFGAGVCFTINAVSFIAVLGSLLLMKLPPYVPHKSDKNAWQELNEGVQYMKQISIVGMSVLVMAVVSLLVMTYDVTLPAFADVVFKGNAATYGYIRSFIGLGAVIGTVLLASQKKGDTVRRLLFYSTILLGIGLICFSRTSYFPLAMFFAVITGLANMVQNTGYLTLIHVYTDPKMRGRMIGFAALAIFGMSFLGSLLLGAVSQKIGAPNSLLIQGMLALVIAAVFSRFFIQDKLVAKTKEPIKQAEKEAETENPLNNNK